MAKYSASMSSSSLDVKGALMLCGAAVMFSIHTASLSVQESILKLPSPPTYWAVFLDWMFPVSGDHHAEVCVFWDSVSAGPGRTLLERSHLYPIAQYLHGRPWFVSCARQSPVGSFRSNVESRSKEGRKVEWISEWRTCLFTLNSSSIIMTSRS